MWTFLHEILYPLLWAAIGFWIVGRWSVFRIKGIPTSWMQGAFVLKLIAGLAVWAIYTFHYEYRASSDAYGYFDDAMVINGYLFKDPIIWFQFLFGVGLENPELAEVFDQMTRWTFVYTYGIANDNPTIIRVNMLIGLISFGSYHVHTVIFNILSLLGICQFLRFLKSLHKKRTAHTAIRVSALLLFIFPTVLFWGSGVLKESLLLFALGTFLYLLKRGLSGGAKYLFGVALFGTLLLYLKPYVFICLLGPLIAFSLVERFNLRTYLLYPLVLLAIFLIAVQADHFFPAGDLLYILQKKQTDFYNLAEMNDAGSVVHISPVAQEPLAFLIDAPERLAHAMLRPFPWELNKAIYFPAFGEVLLTLILLGAFFIALTKGKLRIRKWKLVVSNSNYLWLTFSFLLVFSLVMGSCVPVIGAVVRYKFPVLILFSGIFVVTSTQTTSVNK